MAVQHQPALEEGLAVAVAVPGQDPAQESELGWAVSPVPVLVLVLVLVLAVPLVQGVQALE